VQCFSICEALRQLVLCLREPLRSRTRLINKKLKE